MGQLKVTIVDRCSVGNLTEHRGVIDFDTYTAGGFPVTAPQFGFQSLRYLDFPSVYYDDVAADPYLVVGGRGRIGIFRVNGGQEVADGAPLGTLHLPFFARGIV